VTGVVTKSYKRLYGADENGYRPRVPVPVDTADVVRDGMSDVGELKHLYHLVRVRMVDGDNGPIRGDTTMGARQTIIYNPLTRFVGLMGALARLIPTT